MSFVVKFGKLGKRALGQLLPGPTPYISWVRRIDRVKTPRRICAMTFDDGPVALPANPDRFQGRGLTDVLLDTLAKYGARASFDVVGDTSENYPDTAGASGSAAWGGLLYDHYPDIHRDDKGGAAQNEPLIRRILEEGHQITNHGYRHIIFGKKPFVYGKRIYFGSYDKALADATRLHALMRDRYGYRITMGRPPHYVDRIGGGFTAYDVYQKLGYQYLGASYDGGGWVPSTHADPEAALEAEIRAMVEPMEAALKKDSDHFCGQIIFQKDGCNMARRTPVAFGLDRQLALLQAYGYSVVSVEELMQESPFADCGREDPDFSCFAALQQTRAIVYSDNHLRPDQPMTLGELAMLLAPPEEAAALRTALLRTQGKAHAYAGAMQWCQDQGFLPAQGKPEAPVTELPEGLFDPVQEATRRNVYKAYRGSGAEAPERLAGKE